MNKAALFISIFFTTLMHSGNAQVKAGDAHISFTLLRADLFRQTTNYRYNSFLFADNTPEKLVTTMQTYGFNYTLPKGAIFCRMEDALYKRFNIWIKFRMGTDDRYSN
jgi:hypothetical protein